MDNLTKILEIDFKNVFIGKDCYIEEDPKMEEMWGYNEENFDGNSILFEIKEQEYIFVGKTIYYFNTKPNKDKIVKFISNMGPNRVPYPFAYGEKNVYFMLDQKFLPYVLIDEKRIVDKDETFDAYGLFFINGMKN